MKHEHIESSIPKEVITYAAGAIEAKLAEIARNTVQPEQELREWVAIFLLSSWTGISNYMPSLRRKTTKMGRPTREMAMANNSHSKSSSLSPDSQDQIEKRWERAGKKVKLTSGKKGFKYNGTHWMQQPKNRKRVIALAKKRAEMRAQKAA